MLKKEIDLRERETNAESGFIDNQKSINAELEKEKVNLEKKLKVLRDSLAIQVEEKKKLIDEYQSKKMDLIHAEREKLTTQSEAALSIKKQAESEAMLLQARQRSQKEWEGDIERKVLHRYDMELKDLTSQLEQERISRENDGKKLLSLHEQLRQFRDLERELEDQNVESVQEELSNSRRVIKELKAKILISGQDDLKETCEVLEGRVEDQNEEIIDLRRRLEEASTELHTTRLSVQDKHNLAKEKRVLELHNRTLDIAIASLNTQLDELVVKQEGSKAFPVLSRLDQEFRSEPANLQNVPGLKDFAEQIRMGLASIDPSSPLYFREEDVRLFLAGLAMSSLHILQGMSGTGKTSLATAFAKVVGGKCTLIPVQAGWRDKDDLVGHYNSFEKKFYEKETLQAIYMAQLPAYRDRLNLIVLDEMNLSRPEQYFAEFLSAMEIKAAERNIVLVEEKQNNAPNLLMDGRKIKVPENIWFIGTANHDETTNEFADKTYDRAHVMELQRNEKTFNTDRYESGLTYSFDSLKEQFNSAASKHGKKLDFILSKLNECELSLILEEYFEVRWGNRLDRHAKRFIPVIIEAGGSVEEGLDHLLATKVFRRGKVTGRFDINVADLDAVEEALVNTWSELNLTGQPNHSLDCIAKDKKRMERNA
ncbi:MAG: AAA domain-containing protein [Gammaproteobacteria bacterium]|nr:AAA domain-containing protein [Gammaproteobacteria bacterium]